MGGRASRGRPQTGGVHVYGHCVACNGLQGRYDEAYAEFCGVLSRRLRPSMQVVLPAGAHPLPDVTVRPGAVARAVLIGMTALNPNLRRIHSALIDRLLDRSRSFRLPEGLALRVAATDSPVARVAGSVGGVLLFHPLRPNGTALGVMSVASVYFRPAAWHLVAGHTYSLVDLQRWPDVSRWTAYPPDVEVPVRRLLRRIPAVLHPSDDPDGERAGWCQLLSSEITVFAEGEMPNAVA